jgi:hypothetical protein
MGPPDIREMLYNALPLYVHNTITTANDKCFKKTKTDSKVFSYFDKLLVIGSMARDKKFKSVQEPIAHKKQN